MPRATAASVAGSAAVSRTPSPGDPNLDRPAKPSSADGAGRLWQAVGPEIYGCASVCTPSQRFSAASADVISARALAPCTAMRARSSNACAYRAISLGVVMVTFADSSSTCT